MRGSGWLILAMSLALGLVTGVSGCRTAQGPDKGEAKPAAVVRAPAVAGAFYPGDAKELADEVKRDLGQVAPVKAPGELVALIVPHAGYTYSAPVAAYAYRQLEGKHFDTVVVIGPSHRFPFEGIALSTADAWATPLGQVAVDRAGCEALLKSDAKASLNEAVHGPEHSIEVQLPFLQSTLKDFKVLPVLMVDFSDGNCAAAAKALADNARGKSVLLVASSDMSHYPAYEDATRVDGQTLSAIQTMDPQQVEAATHKLMGSGVRNLETCLCGEGPVKTVLMACKLLGADKVQVLRYANSGDVPAGQRDRVVGYGAVAIYRPPGRAGKEAAEMTQGSDELNERQQQRLLTVARQTIETYVRTGKVLQVDETDPALLRKGAAFVTLRIEGMLRGCIGSLEPEAPLIHTVRDRAISAAAEDPRFPPASVRELPDLEIEISVLSPLRKAASYEEMVMSKHGVIVEQGGRRGVFLPQVADETGWDRDTFLSHLCSDKAGLPADAWKRGAALYLFTVQAFSSPAPR
jgi:hypothetical protein